MKDENVSSSKGVAPPSAPSGSVPAPPTGPITEDEIRAFLLQMTTVTTHELVSKFNFQTEAARGKEVSIFPGAIALHFVFYIIWRTSAMVP